MGTYTTNYNLFLPSVGEQGWGELVNGNFETIDTAMAGLNTRVGTLETEMDAVEERITTLEPLSVIHVDENQNVTFPAGITVENVTGNTRGFLFVIATIQTYEGDEIYATCPAQSTNTGTSTGKAVTLTVENYVCSHTFPIRHTYGVYTRESDVNGNILPSITTRTLKIEYPTTGVDSTFYYKKDADSSYTSFSLGSSQITKYITLEVGSTYTLYAKFSSTNGYVQGIKMSLPQEPTYYLKYHSP